MGIDTLAGITIRMNGKTALQLVREGTIRGHNHHCVNLHDRSGEPFPGLVRSEQRDALAMTAHVPGFMGLRFEHSNSLYAKQRMAENDISAL